MEYEVKYKNNKKILTEFYKTTVCKPYKYIGIVILVVGILQMAGIFAGLSGTVELAFKKSTLIILIVMGVAELAIGVLMCLYHKVMGRMAMKNGMKLHKGVMPETVISFGDDVLMSEGKTNLHYAYSKFTALKENKDMFCLMMGKYAGIVLPKDGFTIGKQENFSSWIKGQCKRLV